MKPISIQLYTVRDAAAQDFPGTLKKIAEIGYKGVEFAGLHGHKPSEIAMLVQDLGLQVSSSHTALPTKENLTELLDVELALGNKRVISGFGPDRFTSVDACKKAAEEFNTACELVKPYGLTYGMHNHWAEFASVDGKRVYDILMEEAPEMFSELDVYWAAYGKSDPVQVINEYKSRMPILHIKDGTLKENAPHLAVGDGVLDILAIIGAADPNVLDWLIVELDSFDGDMLDAVKKSYDYLTSSGLAEGNK
ncbi:MAG: sugar phosphate isomerase/epimerase [Armatimonadota bacterium]